MQVSSDAGSDSTCDDEEFQVKILYRVIKLTYSIKRSGEQVAACSFYSRGCCIYLRYVVLSAIFFGPSSFKLLEL